MTDATPREGERVERLVARAARLLGDGAPPASAPLADQIGALTTLSGDAAADRRRHGERMARVQAEAASDAAIDAAIAQLRRITAPGTLLDTAPAALCAASSFGRVLLSDVAGSVLTARAVHVDGDPRAGAAALAALAAAPVRLAHPRLEAEAVRRRRAIIAVDGEADRLDPSWTKAMGWGAVAVAPIVVRGAAVAVLHADAGAAALVARHAELLWSFAVGVARAYESAALRRRLRDERNRMHELTVWLDARSVALDATVSLDVEPEAKSSAEPTPLPGASDSAVFDGVLTRRELEVLRLLGEGRSNRAIADELVVSTGTVKFHVNNILGKLRASNRAEAVSRYFALLDARGGGAAARPS